MRYIVTKIIVYRLEKNIKRALSIVKPILNSNEITKYTLRSINYLGERRKSFVELTIMKNVLFLK